VPKRFQWCYSQKKKGMYIDGHKREDVIAYHKQFMAHFLTQYAPWMYTWDHDGAETKLAVGFPVPGNCPFQVILVTHNESTSIVNDERKARWIHESQNAVPKRKGNGSSSMISGFLTSEWEHLRSEDGTECYLVI